MKDIWIFSRIGGVYLSFWLAITAVYQALFMLTPNTDYVRATNASLAIIGTAALLGVIVVTLALRWPKAPKLGVGLIAGHTAGAILYSSLWILAVMTSRNIGPWLTSGEFVLCTPPTHVIRWHIVAGSALYAAMTSAIYAMRVTRAAEIQRERAELKALRAQLNPHFMFNTLHTISMLFRRDKVKAEAALEAFSDIVRYALHPPSATGPRSAEHSLVTLRDEWEAVSRYVELEQLRLGDRLRMHFNVDESMLDHTIPALTLQPILENAVVHGAAVLENGSDVWVNIRKLDDAIEVSVKNHSQPGTPTSSPTLGVGLSAVKAKLEDAFGADVRFTVGANNDGVFECRIVFPRRAPAT